MSSIMDLIGPELSELSAHELENLPYRIRTVKMYLSKCIGQNVSGYKISDEIYYGTNQIRTVQVVCP